MLKTHHHFFRILFQLADGLLVVASFAVAYWIRFHGQLEVLGPADSTATFLSYGPLLVGLVFIWFIALQVSGAYKSWRSGAVAKELFAVFRASVMAFLISVAMMHFLAREAFSRAFLILFLGLVVTNLSLGRLGLRVFLRALRRKGLNQRSLLVIGDGELADAVASKILGRPELGIRVLGLIQIGKASSSVATLGTLENLEGLLSEEQVDQALICLKNTDGSQLDGILSHLCLHNVYVRIVPDIAQYAVLGFEVEEFDGLPIVSLNQSPLVGWNAVLKRMSDVVYASAALILFSPVMLALAVLIRLSSRGPIFYRQERMGLDGRTFHMFKFRSMKLDAETQSGAVWAKKDDDRVTAVGKFMRKTSLDELPQLFNVLRGEMSCVGPRPERPVFVQKFRHHIPGYMLRHKVKAGMTGWAQINGFRGNTSLEARIEHDLYYITHWSLWLDLRIMFLTVFKGFVSPHAY